MEEAKLYIKGTYRKSIFHSDQGYVIGLFKVRETNDERMKDYLNKTITFTGYFHELSEDDSYFFYGEELDHPRYGKQYQVTEYERVKPEDKEGIVEFLASDLFPGVGDKLAKKIVETLGENTLNLILEEKSSLMMVQGMTDKKAQKIYECLSKYEESHKTIVYLSELGFSMKDALSLYHTYKGNTISILEHNIYRTIDDIEDITFLKVDALREKVSMNEEDERRIIACILYIMKDLTFKNGDTYLKKEEITSHVLAYLKKEEFSCELSSFFDELEEEEKIIVEGDRYYLRDLYEAEQLIVAKLGRLKKKSKTNLKKIKEVIGELETKNEIVYNDKQKEAIEKALEENLVIITGGPGTGKTTIIKAIVEAYQQLNDYDYDELTAQLALLAPTGRASKRMSESTKLPATTIHRYLKWNKESNSFGVNEENKAMSHLVIIDEVSMIDLLLLDSLLKGLTDNIKLILVGDYHQLPSVGPGQVLKDLIESETLPTISLNLLYRQEENSYITTLAQEIKENALTDRYLETTSDYTFLNCTATSIRKNLKHLTEQLINKGYDYKRVQVMAPMYRGENGIDLLNRDLQEMFNPQDFSKKEITYGDVVFRENDKVLQLVNNPDENVYNGDVGIIKQIILAKESDSKKNEIYVDYEGNVVRYLPKEFTQLKHGFIISIHKSQGSEFEFVILPICKEYRRMLYRKLIYTAITRAKRKLILLGEPDAFVYAIKNNEEYVRKTSLLEKLQKLV